MALDLAMPSKETKVAVQKVTTLRGGRRRRTSIATGLGRERGRGFGEKEELTGHTVLLFIGREENQMGEIEREAAAGFAGSLRAPAKPGRKGGW